MICVFPTLLIALTKYLTRSYLMEKGLCWGGPQGTQSVRKGRCVGGRLPAHTSVDQAVEGGSVGLPYFTKT